MTEEAVDIIQDWEFLMEGLSKSKTKKHKYARVYEKIVRYNEQNDVKMLLSMAYRVFKKVDDIKMSKGHKNSEEVGEFYESDFYVNGTIMIDQFMAFCDTMAELIVEKIPEIERFGHLEIKQDGQIKKLNIMY